MNKIQIIILGVFGAAILAAVLIFSGAVPGLRLQGAKLGTVTIWGTLPSPVMNNILGTINLNQNRLVLRYVEKNTQNYESELLNSLATGRGPDLWLLSQDLILKHWDKTYPLTSRNFTERNFRDIFIDGADLYITGVGILGIPFTIDPMVLYWNKALFRNAGLTLPPKTWNEFTEISQKITLLGESGEIIRNGAALGIFDNVRNSKEILSLFILQSGNPIVNKNNFKPTLTETSGLPVGPAKSALRFFTDFANRQSSLYSWNRTMPYSDEAFIGERLAVYLGFASEYNNIKEKNPHLEFDVSPVPQIVRSSQKITFGKIQALAISNMTKNPQGALAAINLLTDSNTISQLSENTFLPPVRRDLLARGSSNPVFAVFMESAIQARAWLEPDPASATQIFKNMAETALFSPKNTDQAISDANLRLGSLLPQ